MREIFYPFTFLYRAGLLCDKAIKSSRRKVLPVPVFSVGNITCGGSGKTPLVIKAARDILNMGFRPSVVSRGYGRRHISGKEKIVIVSDGRSAGEIQPYESGDEPFEMAERLKGISVTVGLDRYAAAQVALERFNPDVVILDDGFQRWDVARSLDIVCVNAANPFGNGMLIPAGILREPLHSLERADAVVLTNVDMAQDKEIDRLCDVIGRLSRGKNIPVYRSHMEFRGLLKITSDGVFRRAEDKNFLRSTRLVGFSGLGSNENFEKFIEKNIAPLEKFYAFGDHHWYSADEIKYMLNRHKGSAFITTLKDAVRIIPLIKNKEIDISALCDGKIYAAEADMVFDNGEEEASWQKLLKERLSSIETAR